MSPETWKLNNLPKTTQMNIEYAIGVSRCNMCDNFSNVCFRRKMMPYRVYDVRCVCIWRHDASFGGSVSMESKRRLSSHICIESMKTHNHKAYCTATRHFFPLLPSDSLLFQHTARVRSRMTSCDRQSTYNTRISIFCSRTAPNR